MTNAKTKNDVVDKNTWSTFITEFDQMLNGFGQRIDIEGVNYLSPIIDGYMLSPVALMNNKAVEAKTVVFSDIKNALDIMIQSDMKIIMYMLIWAPSMPVYQSLNGETDVPFIRHGAWRMLFAPVK